MRKFLTKLSYTVFPLWLIAVSIVSYLAFYVSPNATGDIGRLGFIQFGHSYNENLEKDMLNDTLFQTVYKTDELKTIHVNVLTIGDSFSQQKNGGYQNYLCLKGLNIANCYRHLYSSPVQYAFNLLDKKIVDSTNTQFLIVESVEREFIDHVNSFSVNKIESPSKSSGTASNVWSLSRARDYIYYRIGKKNTTPIFMVTLDGDYFSSDEPRQLYFYNQDIKKELHIDKYEEEKVKQLFETLHAKAAENGISLILMIAVDKYDLYQKHVVTSGYPIKTINEDLERIIGNKPSLMLSKQYLLPLVEQGTKDVFKYNDTHWSHIASKAVAEELYNRTKILNK